MKITETPIPGLLIIEPQVFEDERGYFFETYNFRRYTEKGVGVNFIQDNESKSAKGVIRGLHYQLNPYSQSKLVRVVRGVVYDVALDLRKGSPTFGQWFGIELNEKDKKQFFIPKGFAHGFSVLSETAIFSYKCDELYNKEAERAIHVLDAKLKIDWKLGKDEWLVSEKDKIAPTFENAEMNFTFNL